MLFIKISICCIYGYLWQKMLLKYHISDIFNLILNLSGEDPMENLTSSPFQATNQNLQINYNHILSEHESYIDIITQIISIIFKQIKNFKKEDPEILSLTYYASGYSTNKFRIRVKFRDHLKPAEKFKCEHCTKVKELINFQIYNPAKEKYEFYMGVNGMKYLVEGDCLSFSSSKLHIFKKHPEALKYDDPDLLQAYKVFELKATPEIQKLNIEVESRLDKRTSKL
jgi:hypothetical protein